ncbi:MAG: hypothetical protein JWO10_1, partial [Microbacteriaceae bacterium]|nr:hypothetical protein [Microbacteriaceae bacterium]
MIARLVALVIAGLVVMAPAVPASATPPSLAAESSCTVANASLDWGFKESFRAYISSSIANGEWTVDGGATYETPRFGWAHGTGTYDPQTGQGLVGLPGSVTFTGHGGILHTTIGNPQLLFVNATTAFLLLDVHGTTQGGTPVDSTGVRFAKLALSVGRNESTSTTLAVKSAPATLTSMGAAAFGTYVA